MYLILIAAAAVAAMALLVYIRHINRRQVASLFLSTARDLLTAGSDMEPLLRQASGRFARRAPFSFLKAEELTLFVHVLQDLGSPIEVGAELLQQCETKRSIAEIRDPQKLTHLAYITDLKLSLQQLIQNAKALHKKVPNRYPSITVALLASLSVREGWTFIEEQSDALVFDYRQERVRIPKQGSGKDAARLIIFEETAQRPLPVRPETDQLRKSARQELMDAFDTVFDETFSGLGKVG
jgi:hypothetical protein